MASRRAPASSTMASVMRCASLRFWSAVRPVNIVICTRGITKILHFVQDPAGPARTPSEAASISQFVPGEEIAQLEAGGVVGIRAVNGVVFNVACPLFADRAFLSVGRIRRTHELAQIGDSIFFFQCQHDDRPARHEIGQRTEKRPARMDGVELFSLMLRYLKHLHSQYPETIFFKLFDD